MLRHACGYKLADDGHDTPQADLGHRKIHNTTHYAAWRHRKSRNFFGIDRRCRYSPAIRQLDSIPVDYVKPLRIEHRIFGSTFGVLEKNRQ